MSLIISILRLLLSVVFAVAGVTKLLDQRGTREAVVNFGAPQSLSSSLAILLPLAELSVAVGLMFTSTASWSGWLALLLLALFIVAISVNLSRGQIHDCHCFGQLYSRPLGWPTLVRNIIFALGAVLIIWQHAIGNNPALVPTLTDAIARLTAIHVVLITLGAAALVAAFLYWRRRAARQALEEAEGLPIGSVAPDFELEAYEGGTQTLSHLLQFGKPLLLIFTNPHCGPCIVLFNEISEWQKAHDERLTIALITRGTIKDNFVNIARNQLGQVLLQGEKQTAVEYRAQATPMAVLVDEQGRIASHVAGGAHEIRALLQKFLVDSNGHNPQSA